MALVRGAVHLHGASADGMASYKQGCGPHIFVRELLVQQIWKGSETGKYLVVVDEVDVSWLSDYMSERCEQKHIAVNVLFQARISVAALDQSTRP